MPAPATVLYERSRGSHGNAGLHPEDPDGGSGRAPRWTRIPGSKPPFTPGTDNGGTVLMLRGGGDVLLGIRSFG